MNAHDSEKVIGTLLEPGLRAGRRRPKKPSWCSTTPAASAIKPSRRFSTASSSSRSDGKGKTFAVLGCVAQQEGEKIFEKAPHVSLVCGSASYNQLPQMLVQLEAGNRRVTGLSLDTDDTFETPLTRRDNPHRAYITIIEGCDKSCAYCVVPFTRGPERSRTSASVIAEARRARATPAIPKFSCWARTSTAIATRRRPAGISRRCCDQRGPRRRASAACASPLRIRAISCKPIIDAIDANPALCNHVHLPVQSGSTRVLDSHAAPLHARRIHAPHRVDEERAQRPIAITTDIIVGFPGETEADFEDTLELLEEVRVRFHLQLQIFAPAQHAGAGAGRSDSGGRESPAADDRAGAAARDSDPAERRATSGAWKNAWWRASTKPRASGSGALRRTRR